MKQFKIENGKLYMREVERASAGNCPFCGEPVYVSEGQVITYFRDQPVHKKCRKKNK